MQYVPYIVIGFLLIVVLVLLAFKSGSVPINPITNWTELHKMLSVQLAALTGLLAGLIPAAEQLQQRLPEIQSIQALHSLTSSPAYQTCVSLLGFFIIVARAWQQGSLKQGDASVVVVQGQVQPKASQLPPVGQGGYARILLLPICATLAALVLLGACATTPAPTTPAESIVYVEAAASEADLLADQLLRAGKIKKTDAQTVLTASKTLQAAVGTAKAFLLKGDEAGAQAQLSAVSADLALVSNFLTANQQ